MKLDWYKIAFWGIGTFTAVGLLILIYGAWGAAQLSEPDLVLIREVKVPHFEIRCYRANWILSDAQTMVRASEQRMLWNTDRLILQEQIESVDDISVKMIGIDSCYISLCDSGSTVAVFRVSLRHELQLYVDTILDQQISICCVKDESARTDFERATSVDMFIEAGSYFANVVSSSDSTSIWARRVIGRHTKSGIDYRLLDSNYTVFEGPSRDAYRRAQRADTLWQLLGGSGFNRTETDLQAIYDRASQLSSPLKLAPTHSVTWRKGG